MSAFLSPSGWRLAVIVLAWLATAACTDVSTVPRWGQFETAFASTASTDNPFQDQSLLVTFTSPSKRAVTVRGFWDGGRIWRVRFSPDEPGVWTFLTHAVPDDDSGLQGRTGRFTVADRDPDDEGTVFERHGPVRVAASRTSWVKSTSKGSATPMPCS